MAMGTNNYTRSIDETMNVLNTFAKTRKGVNPRKINYKTEDTEVTFAQAKDLSEVTFYSCGKKVII